MIGDRTAAALLYGPVTSLVLRPCAWAGCCCKAKKSERGLAKKSPEFAYCDDQDGMPDAEARRERMRQRGTGQNRTLTADGRRHNV
jgi:hypothetical protein